MLSGTIRESQKRDIFKSMCGIKKILENKRDINMLNVDRSELH